jgi:hypothetical protein
MRKTLGKVVLIPYTFVLLNCAPVAGLYGFVLGRSLGIWNSGVPKDTWEERKA